jgi:methyl-accepting chemotaxis protein
MLKQAAEKVGAGVAVSSSVEQALNSISAGVRDVNKLMLQIAGASNDQATRISEIEKAVSEMDKVTQQNAAGAEQSAAASEELSAQAAELTAVVGKLSEIIEGRLNK